MRAVAVTISALLIALAFAGCMGDNPPPSNNNTQTSGTAALMPAQPAAMSCTVPEAGGNGTGFSPAKPRVRLETVLGNITLELYLEQAPQTVCNFANLTRSGFYDGVKFHRTISNFVIQGGDPNTKQPKSATNNWGSGGPGYSIPDEFHAGLRHNAAGILSMANSGPHSGGSQFFITLASTPHLNDRHTVFGRVVEGMDVVNVIGAAPADQNGNPANPVTITRATLLPDPAVGAAQHGVGIHSVLSDKKTEPGRVTNYAVVLKNTGNTRDNLTLRVEAPAGWKTEQAAVNAKRLVPAGATTATFATFTPPADAEKKTYQVTFIVNSSHAGVPGARETVNVTVTDLGAQVEEGTTVTANYAGFLPDGRLFDTSIRSVAKDPDMPKFTTQGGWQDRNAFNTFSFTVGSGVIPGFTNLAKTAKAQETVTGYIPYADAYAQAACPGTNEPANQYCFPLLKRDLIFELEIVSV